MEGGRRPVWVAWSYWWSASVGCVHGDGFGSRFTSIWVVCHLGACRLSLAMRTCAQGRHTVALWIPQLRTSHTIFMRMEMEESGGWFLVRDMWMKRGLTRWACLDGEKGIAEGQALLSVSFLLVLRRLKKYGQSCSCGSSNAPLYPCTPAACRLPLACNPRLLPVHPCTRQQAPSKV